MSGFLLNMIQRHQGAVDTVQPRIRSMFEPEATSPINKNDFANATNEVVTNDLEPKFDRPFDFVQPSNASKQVSEHMPEVPASYVVQQASQVDLNVTAGGYSSLDSNRLDLMNAQIQTVLTRLGRKTESTEPNHEHFSEKIEFPSNTHAQLTDKVKSPETSKFDGIEETISRLQNEINRVAKLKQSPETGERSPFVDINSRAIDLQSVSPNVRQGSKVADPFEKIDQPSKQPDGIEPAPANHQTGSLLVPAWLTALQAELNNRWYEVNAHSKLERVVNVTIGRVEIRAANPAPKQQNAVREKPKGILSLDDYLKQRESKVMP